jgi:hypothetical protein
MSTKCPVEDMKARSNRWYVLRVQEAFQYSGESSWPAALLLSTHCTARHNDGVISGILLLTARNSVRSSRTIRTRRRLDRGGLIDRFGPERTRREGMYRTRAATCMDGTRPRFPAFTDTRGIGPSRPSGSCTRASGLVNVCELPSHASNELRPVFAGIGHKQQWGRTSAHVARRRPTTFSPS